MGIRSCALDCEPFRILKNVYDHRDQAIDALKASGKPLIGQLGYDVPDEVILAAGMIPVRMWSDPQGCMAMADKYLEYAFDPMMRAKFSQIVDGRGAAWMDGLAISNSTDVIIRMYLYLRELKRSEPELNIPRLSFIDWLFTRNRMYQERDEMLMGRFIKEMEEWCGHPITEASIKEAACICNEEKRVLRCMNTLRQADLPRISGCEALVIIGSAFFMDRKVHSDLVKQVVQSAENWPEIVEPKVFYTGSIQESVQLYECMESYGMVIVGEDHDWGSRFFDRDYNLSLTPERALTDEYMLRTFSSKKAFVSQRVQALHDAVKKSGARGVIFYNHIYEEAASWDYPEQKKCLESEGILTTHYCQMPWPLPEFNGLKGLEQFAGELKKNERR